MGAQSAQHHGGCHRCCDQGAAERTAPAPRAGAQSRHRGASPAVPKQGRIPDGAGSVRPLRLRLAVCRPGVPGEPAPGGAVRAGIGGTGCARCRGGVARCTGARTGVRGSRTCRCTQGDGEGHQLGGVHGRRPRGMGTSRAAGGRARSATGGARGGRAVGLHVRFAGGRRRAGVWFEPAGDERAEPVGGGRGCGRWFGGDLGSDDSLGPGGRLCAGSRLFCGGQRCGRGPARRGRRGQERCGRGPARRGRCGRGPARWGWWQRRRWGWPASPRWGWPAGRRWGGGPAGRWRQGPYRRRQPACRGRRGGHGRCAGDPKERRRCWVGVCGPDRERAAGPGCPVCGQQSVGAARADGHAPTDEQARRADATEGTWGGSGPGGSADHCTSVLLHSGPIGRPFNHY